MDLPSPDRLYERTAAVTTRIYDRHGRMLYEILDPHGGAHTPVALAEMPTACIKATQKALLAAVATMISYGLYPVIVYFATRRHLAWKIPWRSLAKIIASSVVAAAFWLLTSISLGAGVVGWLWFAGVTLIGIMLYFASLLLLGELRGYEKRYLAAVLRGARSGKS